MKIALFDTKHFEVIYGALRFFDTPQNQLFMFVTPAVYRLFEQAIPNRMDNYIWLISQPGAEKAFLESLQKTVEVEGIELVWISTIDNNFHYCAYILRNLKRCGAKSVLTVHNLNYWFRPKFSFNLLAVKNVAGIFFLRKTVDGINVLGETLAHTLRTRLNYKKPIFIVSRPPIPVYASKNNAKLPGLHLVVPGGIERKRRDYDFLLDALERLLLSPGRTLKLTLLGGPIGDYGNRILQRCAALQEKGADIFYYTKFIEQTEFDTQMMSADFVVSPITIHTSFSGTAEIYGDTKSSGVIGDIIQYSIPALIPEGLSAPAELEHCLLRYNTIEDLQALVQKLLSNKNYKNATYDAAKQSFQYYSTVGGSPGICVVAD